MAGRRCLTCSHAQIREINARLRAGEHRSTIAIDFNMSPDAIERHALRHLSVSEHLQPEPKMVAEPADEPDEPMVAEPAEPVRGKATQQQAKTMFLASLAQFGSMTRACKEAGSISRARVHRWLEDDEVFSFAYRQSLAAAIEGLEEVARERATRGAKIERQIWRGGNLIETVIEFRPSDAALITLLKAQKPDVYRERVDQNVSGEVQVRYTNDWRSVPSGNT